MSATSHTAIAVVAQVFTILFCLSPPVIAAPMTDLVRQLEGWIDANSDLPPAKAPPRIRIADDSALYEDHEAAMTIGSRTRGLYEPETSTITLMYPWSSTDLEDASVLLHELVHHRQAGIYYSCPAAQELPAYRLQETWLAAHQMVLDVNWMGIVLASSCAPRDIHPD